MLLTEADVTFRSGDDTLGAYFVVPEREEPVPGAVMIHDVFGLRPVARRQARHLASLGVAALYPHLLRGTPAADPSTDPDAAKKSMPALRAITVDQCMGDVQAGLEYLRGYPQIDNSRLLVWGYCWGGKMALRAAARVGGHAATVVWHGMLAGEELAEIDAIRGPVLGLFGGADQRIPPESVKTLAEHCTAVGAQPEFYTFPGAPHSFCDDTRESAFHRASCEGAWTEVARFIRVHLRSGDTNPSR